MEVKLMTPTDFIKTMEHNAAYAMLTCHANTGKLKETDPRVFIEKAIKEEHESILEHITLTYEVNNLSRACLQELARHRHISLSVESTRHTLEKDFYSDNLLNYHKNIEERAIIEIVQAFIYSMKNATEEEEYFKSNDYIKYIIPELWPTNLVMTTNIRELRHIVKLRTAPAALKEFRFLAINFVEVLPDEFKYLLEDCVYTE